MKRLLAICLAVIWLCNHGETATRMYFPQTEPAAITPAIDPGWDYTSEYVYRRWSQTKGSSTLAWGAVIGPWASNSQNQALDRVYVSDPLEAQTISGFVFGQLMAREYDVKDKVLDCRSVIKVVSNNGSMLRGTLLPYTNHSSGTFLANTAAGRNKMILEQSQSALTSVAAHAGDRLVIELGWNNPVKDNGSVTPEASGKWGENAPDLPRDNTTTTDGAGWVEFSQTLVFQGGGPPPKVYADFNGDGYADLAIGVPGEDLGALQNDAGAVNVLYGSPQGLTATRNQFWTQDSPGILDAAEANDSFGAALAVGDFNGDGFADLAIGIPGESVLGSTGNQIIHAGAVAVLYGSAAGLSVSGNQFWTQDSPGILDAAEADDNFGARLAAGDFNHDGYLDLAVGVPGEDVGTKKDAGAVNVLYGSPNGLTATRNQLLTQDSPGILDAAEANDTFGDALASGDFNGDGFADLAIGVPRESLANNTLGQAGAVNVLYGSANGLTAARNQFWTQNSPGILDTSEAADLFGGELAAGDFNGDGYGDLAIGAYFENVGDIQHAGAVNVIYGSANGLSAAKNQFWTKDNPEAFEAFGFKLVAGDFNGDGFAELAIGDTGEDVGSASDAGAVIVLRGTANGLSTTGMQVWNQNSPGILDTAETADFFGSALAAADFDGDGFADLAVGVGESVRTISSAGAVNVLYGSANGLAAAGNQFWTQDSPGILDAAEAFDGFGNALSK